MLNSLQHTLNTLQHITSSLKLILSSLQHIPISLQLILNSLHHILSTPQHIPNSLQLILNSLHHILNTLQHILCSHCCSACGPIKLEGRCTIPRSTLQRVFGPWYKERERKIHCYVFYVKCLGKCFKSEPPGP